ncbi:thioredoxin family protein [Anaerocolumna xylanovorans]|uniref:Thioredoxin n=1 Tax=Anaerocolumna xylanovorans DSM 12503 TaxID=1121345 RepID=A0A1M7Y5D0_9FIRM|nr:thioredoxin domain-containing protein [Anaerocolumna xylanovorans]SHO47712.1 thioredoxin [Anaerocolumna xylanovorans DSM 12503]
MALRIREENFDEEVLKSKLPVIVDFYSDSCMPCRQLGVTLSELEEDYGDRIKFVKVNVNFDISLAERYGVMASPTLLFFKEGIELHRLKGLTKKEVLIEHIEKIK